MRATFSKIGNPTDKQFRCLFLPVKILPCPDFGAFPILRLPDFGDKTCVAACPHLVQAMFPNIGPRLIVTGKFFQIYALCY